MEQTPEATRDLALAVSGDHEAARGLAVLVYQNLRRLARSHLARRNGSVSLGPTDLVHEVYVRLLGAEKIDWRGRTRFFALAATEMRRVLVDHVRQRCAWKRGGGRLRVDLTEDLVLTPARALDLLDLDEALDHLAVRSERQCRVAELRLFAGLLVEETAQALGVSERTVRSDWQMARAWLAHELTKVRERRHA